MSQPLKQHSSDKRPKGPPLKKRLTYRTVHAAKADNGNELRIWDTLQRGLLLRVYASGVKAWWCVYSRQNRPRWYLLVPLTLWPSPTRRKAAKVMALVADGKDPVAERAAQRSSGSFSDLHKRYVEQCASKNNRSWQHTSRLVLTNILPRWGKLQASTITRADAKQLLASVAKPSVATQAMLAASAVFQWAVDEDMLSFNPCRGIAKKVTNDRERVLSPSEYAPFWRALDDIDLVQALALRSVLLTGQRPGEVAHMRLEHIKDGWWEMPGDVIPGIWPGTKNGKSHRVFLAEPVQAIIAELVEPEAKPGYVFARPIGKAVQRLDAAMRDVCSTLQMEKATPHDLRRSFGSLVTGLGFGRQSMDRILNHADHTVGSIYDRHGYAAEDRHIMTTVASSIMGMVEGRHADTNLLTFAR